MEDSLFGNIDLSAKSISKTKRISKKAVKKTTLNESIKLDAHNMFGEDFSVKELVKKVKAPKEAKEVSAEQKLKSKKLSLNERLAIINTNVLKVLGKQKANVLVIKDRQTLHNYISAAIAARRIAVDTETNNSLDPVTCKLMGPCFYYPGGKQAYVPLNHRNPDTKERLSWQLTEKDIAEELERINEAKIDIIMHNGKFDYEVLKCTTGVKCIPTWDTMVCARLLNENELAGLKWQYVNKIDKEQEKYSIDKLFENIAYADVDPDIFALYAATDAFLTDSLYIVQHNELYNSFKYEQLEVKPDSFELFYLTEVETTRGYVVAKDLVEADLIKSDNNLLKINKIVNNFSKVIIFYSLT